MAKRMINGIEMETGHIPFAVRECGFQNAEEVERVAKKFGKLVTPMSIADVYVWFASGNHRV